MVGKKNQENEGMKEEWTDKLRRKLDGHEMTPPAGLWEGISNEMGLEPATVSSKPAIIRKWYWATAAVVLALAGFFAFYAFDEQQPKLEARNEVRTESGFVDKAPDYQPVIVGKPAIKAEPKTTAGEQLQTTNDEQPQTPVEEQPAPSVEEKSEPQQETQAEYQQKKQTCLPDVTEPATTLSYSEESSRWTIGLAGSNGLLLAANSNTVDMRTSYNDASLANYFAGNSPGPAQAYSITDVESKHHIPLHLGLSLQYQLNERIALISGISYTCLKSEFRHPSYSNLNFDQKLSYLGIPVGISWKLLSTEHFSIYLAGGTMIEKCISAEVSKGEISSHPWQWSANAAVGTEYNFTRQFGVYLEPSLGYYFDDGTKLEHYFKEHPLAPSLQFGLRLHLK